MRWGSGALAFALVVVLLVVNPWPSAADPPAVEVVSSTVNVRPTDDPAGSGSASLRAVLNEFESFQIVIRAATSGLTDVNVTPGALSGPGGAVIPAASVRIHRLDYVNLAVRSDGEGATGRWGDPLIPEIDALDGQNRAAFPIASIPLGENRVAWVDVLVPIDAAPGTYNGTVAVTTGQGNVDVPVEVEVVGLEIPSTPTLRSMFRVGGFGFPICQAHTPSNNCGSAAANWDMHARYAEVALNNRVTVADPWPYDLSPVGPTAGFGQRAQYEAHFLPLVDGTANTLLDGARLTVVAPAAFASLHVDDRCKPDCLDAWKADAAANDFLDRLTYYPCDEPGTDGAKWDGCIDRAEAGNATAPRVPAFVTGTIDELVANDATDAFDIIVPVINRIHDKSGPYVGNQRPDYDAYLAGGGRELWLYSSCNSFSCDATESAYYDGWPGFAIDAPANQHRAMGWMAFRYDATGHLYYHTVAALEDAWDDCTLDNGSCIYVEGANGDGTLFYPGNGCAPTPADRSCVGGTTDIPIESVRLKRIRDGHEDHELLRWLEANGHAAEASALAVELYPTAYAATASKDGPSPTPGGPADTIDEARDRLMDLVAAAAPSAQPIAFSSDRDGDREVYVTSIDGAVQTALTDNDAFDGFPAWSPDRDRIAFTSDRDGDREIWVMDADGSDPVQLTSNAAIDEKPAWSPDGESIAFVSTRAGNPDIWIVDADGANPRALTSAPEDDFDPAWSPDGDRLVFSSARPGGDGVDLHVVDADGANLTRITSAPGDDDTPAWSPDGTTIAFNRIAPAGPYEIWTVAPDGTGEAILADAPGHQYAPSWSPNGGALVYVYDEDGSLEGAPELATLVLDGFDFAVITDNAALDLDPDWWRATGGGGGGPTTGGDTGGDTSGGDTTGGDTTGGDTTGGDTTGGDTTGGGTGGDTGGGASGGDTGGEDDAAIPGVVRLAGADRYATAAAVALDRFDPADVTTVYLATGQDYPDALAGGPLAAATGAPILLARRDELPTATREAIATLRPARVVALGGSTALPDAVLLDAARVVGASTDRIAGADRWATAAAIARRLPAGASTVYLATGLNYPDALAGGAVAAGAPIVLTRPDALPSATVEVLGALRPARVVALGGTTVVSDAALAQAAAVAGASPGRLAGGDRYATAAVIAGVLDGAVDTVYLATGENYPDALAGAPAAAAEGAPILLTRPDHLPDPTATYLQSNPVVRVVILGGEGVVFPAVRAVVAALTGN